MGALITVILDINISISDIMVFIQVYTRMPRLSYIDKSGFLLSDSVANSGFTSSIITLSGCNETRNVSLTRTIFVLRERNGHHFLETRTHSDELRRDAVSVGGTLSGTQGDGLVATPTTIRAVCIENCRLRGR